MLAWRNGSRSLPGYLGQKTRPEKSPEAIGPASSADPRSYDRFRHPDPHRDAVQRWIFPPRTDVPVLDDGRRPA
jgi:hypothetical protein